MPKPKGKMPLQMVLVFHDTTLLGDPWKGDVIEIMLDDGCSWGGIETALPGRDDHPLFRRLRSIKGVEKLAVLLQSLFVGKSKDSGWGDVLPQVFAATAPFVKCGCEPEYQECAAAEGVRRFG